MSYLFATHGSNTYTLDRKPNFEPSEVLEDPTIKTPVDGGYVQTRARFTRTRKTFTFELNFISSSVKTILDNLLSAVKIGADSFTFHHWGSTDYTVRFNKAPTFKTVHVDGSDVFYSVQIELQEV